MSLKQILKKIIKKIIYKEKAEVLTRSSSMTKRDLIEVGILGRFQKVI